MRLGGVARAARDARDVGAINLHVDEVCQLVASYSIENLLKSCQQRTLILANGATAHCMTSRVVSSHSPTYVFNETHFHAALKQLRSKDLLDVATLDLVQRNQESSARQRFSLRQRFWLIGVGVLLPVVVWALTLSTIVDLLGLIFSLFFFTLVLLRAICLVALK